MAGRREHGEAGIFRLLASASSDRILRVFFHSLLMLTASGGNDVDPESRSRVNESLYPGRVVRGVHHETQQAEGGVDRPRAQSRRAADRPGQNRRRGLPCHRSDAADLQPLAAAVQRHEGRGTQAADSAAEGERPTIDVLSQQVVQLTRR